eukprot:6196901-Pleurochrysis_carterae.AAC.1
MHAHARSPREQCAQILSRERAVRVRVMGHRRCERACACKCARTCASMSVLKAARRSTCMSGESDC